MIIHAYLDVQSMWCDIQLQYYLFSIVAKKAILLTTTFEKNLVHEFNHTDHKYYILHKHRLYYSSNNRNTEISFHLGQYCNETFKYKKYDKYLSFCVCITHLIIWSYPCYLCKK